MEFALCRKTTKITGMKTREKVIRKLPYCLTPNLQDDTNPVKVKVAVYPVNLVGRKSNDFTPTYDTEFPTLSVTKGATKSNINNKVQKIQENALQTSLLSTNKITFNITDALT